MNFPPWVQRLPETVPCEGKVYSRYSIRKASHPDPKVRLAHAERIRCKSRAGWHFTAMPPADPFDHVGTTGNYCLKHLWSHGLAGGMSESARTEKWYEENPE